MKKISWELKLGIGLLITSILIYFIKFIIFGNPLNTYLYVFDSLGFLPINVLLVTLILNQLLSIRAKRERLEKLNMVIGMFYSEVGTSLLETFSKQDQNITPISDEFLVKEDWADLEFSQMLDLIKGHTYTVDIARIDLPSLRLFLVTHQDFLLRLLENPILLEHGPFTETLRAVFHLNEELAIRPYLEGLPHRDQEHLKGDIIRAYSNVAREWVVYMQYLKQHYPYLFSLAMRRNPFDRNASVVFQG